MTGDPSPCDDRRLPGPVADVDDAADAGRANPISTPSSTPSLMPVAGSRSYPAASSTSPGECRGSPSRGQGRDGQVDSPMQKEVCRAIESGGPEGFESLTF